MFFSKTNSSPVIILLTSPTNWLDLRRSWHVSVSLRSSCLVWQSCSLKGGNVGVESLRLKYLWMLSSSLSFFLSTKSRAVQAQILNKAKQTSDTESSIWGMIPEYWEEEGAGGIDVTSTAATHRIICCLLLQVLMVKANFVHVEEYL